MAPRAALALLSTIGVWLTQRTLAASASEPPLDCAQSTAATCQQGIQKGWARHTARDEEPSSLLQVSQSLHGASPRKLEQALAGSSTAGKTHGLTSRLAPPAKKSTVGSPGTSDLFAFYAACCFYCGLFVCVCSAFLLLQRWYPQVYAWRATHLWTAGEALWLDRVDKEDVGAPEGERAPLEVGEGPYHWTDDALQKLHDVGRFDIRDFYPAPRQYCRWDANKPTCFGWARASLYTTTEEIEETCGLDAAMFLRFTEMSIRMMLVLFVPLGLGLVPIYLWGGGGFAKLDELSSIDLSNVVYSSAGPLDAKDAGILPKVQWIYWIVCLAVWLVVIYVEWELFGYQREFMVRRKRWLQSMPKPRSTTLLVEGIPDGRDGYCTDTAFRECFEHLWGEGKIESAFVVKNLRDLEGMIQEWRNLDFYRAKAREALQKAKSCDDGVAFQRKIDECAVMMAAKEQEILQYQHETLYPLVEKPPNEQLYASGSRPSDPRVIYSRNGFVTFHDRADAEMALKNRITSNDAEFVMSYAPDPVDVIYHELDASEAHVYVNTSIGVGLIALLFCVCVPIFYYIGNLDALRMVSRIDDSITAGATIAGIVPTLLIVFVMSVVPVILLSVFNAFFTLKATRWQQLVVQRMFFWFEVVLVWVITALGSNFNEWMSIVVHSPWSFFWNLPNRMPFTTHLFMNYVLAQLIVHGINLLRVPILIPYLWMKKQYEDRDALRFAERPYDGIGSLSARLTLTLLAGFIFGTIAPLMIVLVLIVFLACRLIYGYLLPCAEPRKTDLGGDHWCIQLMHVNLGLMIYIALMTGVVIHRAESIIPGVITGLSSIVWVFAFSKFTVSFNWQTLAYEDLVDDASVKTREAPVDKYCQYAMHWKREDEIDL